MVAVMAVLSCCCWLPHLLHEALRAGRPAWGWCKLVAQRQQAQLQRQHRHIAVKAGTAVSQLFLRMTSRWGLVSVYVVRDLQDWLRSVAAGGCPQVCIISEVVTGPTCIYYSL
jgi:hypothetical protein